MKYIRKILLPFSLLFRLAVFIRNLLFDLKILPSRSFKLPVIALGNITVGGTGKTPHVEYLVKLLYDHCRIAVLSRGYKRKTSNFLIVSNKSKVAETGDEPLQIKKKFRGIHVAVDRNRCHGIRRLLKIRPKPEVIILDDAFQHRYVKPGLSILLVDFNRPVFRDMMLPVGNLREPWKNAVRADIVMVTKCPEKVDAIERARFISYLKIRLKQTVFFTRYAYGDPLPLYAQGKNRKKTLNYKSLHKNDAGVILVTGIADPAPLRNFLSGHTTVYDELVFPDHHRFGYRDLKAIADRYMLAGGKTKYIFTTEKDAIRLSELKVKDKQLRKAFYVVPVEVKFLSKGEKPFIKRIAKYLKKAGKPLSL